MRKVDAMSGALLVSKRRDGFTLVELLVVIGIIAVLISMLLPALNAARADARRVACLAKLREVGNGFLLYAAAHRQTIAFNMRYVDRLLVGRDVNWYSSSKVVRGSYVGEFTTEESLLKPYMGHKALLNVLDCPEMIDDPENPAFEVGHNPSYGGSYQLVASDNSGNSYIKLTQVTLPTETFLLADTADLSTNSDTYKRWNWMNEPRIGTSYSVPRFHGRHRGKGNVLWFDGHVSSEPVVPVPQGVSFMVGSGTGVQPRLPEDYARIKIGYLARPRESFDSPDINYYFFVNKERRTFTRK